MFSAISPMKTAHSAFVQLDRRIGELSLLYMDMVVCEALKYSMMVQLDSCRQQPNIQGDLVIRSFSSLVWGGMGRPN